MRTTINIRDEIFQDLVKLTGEKTKTAAVNHALQEWLRIKKIQELRSLRGKIPLADDLDSLRELDKLREE